MRTIKTYSNGRPFIMRLPGAEKVVLEEPLAWTANKTIHPAPMALDLFKNQFVMSQIHANNFKFFQNTHA